MTARRLAGVALALLMAFLALGFWNATRPPVVVRATLAMAGLPPGTRLTVALVGDTHYGHPDMSTARLSGVVARVNALRPDLILLAGDYHGGKLLDWPRTSLEAALAPFAAFRAPLGTYAVLGNHDPAYWVPRVLAAQRGPPLLRERWVDLGPLVLGGLDSVVNGRPVSGVFAGAPAKPRLLLMHEPAHALDLPRDAFTLGLAAHTHGGQVDLPLVGRPMEWLAGPMGCVRGVCDFQGRRVYVTSGVGTSWLPIRFGVPPEVVLLTLVAG